MLFGLCNALAKFQRSLNLTFADMINQFVTVYLDNILVYSKTEEEHLSYFKVFKTTREFHLRFRLKKYDFGRRYIIYLGHRIGVGTVSVDPLKIEGVKTWPTPTCTREL